MIHLTQQQHQEIEQTRDEPVRAVDPTTKAEYVLVRADVYDRLKSFFSAEDQSWGQDAYVAAMEVFARDGWDDPRMDVYNAPTTGEPL